MKSRMKIEEPGAVQVTLTVTMAADQWEKIRDWLADANKRATDFDAPSLSPKGQTCRLPR